MTRKRAVFLDRDGTIIEDRGYLADPDGVCLLSGVVAALAAFRAHGRLLVMVSNQSGITRGLIRRDQHERVHDRVIALLATQGARIDATYYCEHGLDDACECRKPRPGMLLSAARDHDIELTTSLIIGDKASDMGAGRAVGCATALLGNTQYPADFHAPDWPTLLDRLDSHFR